MAGFEGKVISTGSQAAIEHMTLQIEGMTCSSCSSAVEAALKQIDGVHSAAVNLLAAQAEVNALDCRVDRLQMKMLSFDTRLERCQNATIAFWGLR